jgi:energy-coupling factor transport system permease protein
MAALAKVHVPYKFIFTFGMAVRLTPLIDQVYHEIIEAQKLRAHDIDSMGLVKKIRKGYLPIFVPLILGLLRRSSDLDIAIESRAFGTPVRRTYLEEMRFGAADICFIAFTSIVALAILVYSTLYGSLTFGVLPV